MSEQATTVNYEPTNCSLHRQWGLNIFQLSQIFADAQKQEVPKSSVAAAYKSYKANENVLGNSNTSAFANNIGSGYVDCQPIGDIFMAMSIMSIVGGRHVVNKTPATVSHSEILVDQTAFVMQCFYCSREALSRIKDLYSKIVDLRGLRWSLSFAFSGAQDER